MNGRFWFCAALALAGATEALAQVPVSTRCLPEMSETSACVWTGDCSRGGCADKCITNRVLTQSWFVLLDRSIGEESYGACPLLARVVSFALSLFDSSRRRLLSDTEVRDALKEGLLNREASSRAKAEFIRSGRRMSSLIPDDAPSPTSAAFFDYADAPFTTSPVIVDEPSPAFTFTIPSASDVPSNACPDATDLDEAAQGLQFYASLIKEVFTAAASGDTLPADLESRAHFLESPNTNQFVVKMIEDPERLKQYMLDKCVTETIEKPRSYEYGYWLSPEDEEKLDSDLTMTQCVDNFGAWDQFERNYFDVLLACNPPFDAEPDCFSGIGHYMVTSSACATAYARMFNVSNAAPLASVAANVNAIQDACTQVTTEEDCLSANTPVLDTIDELHDSIPINHELDIDVVTVPPAPPVGPVCFGVNCPPPPAALPTGDEPMIGIAPDVPPPDAPGPGDGPGYPSAIPPETGDIPGSPPDPPDTREPNPGVNPEFVQPSSAFVASCSISVAAALLSLVLL